MKIKKLKKIQILDLVFTVKWDNKHAGGYFSITDQKIEIGSRDLELDPNGVFNIIIHEISELIHCLTCTRYDDYSVQDNYKFFMDHKQFETHNRILSGILSKFIALT